MGIAENERRCDGCSKMLGDMTDAVKFLKNNVKVAVKLAKNDVTNAAECVKREVADAATSVNNDATGAAKFIKIDAMGPMEVSIGLMKMKVTDSSKSAKSKAMASFRTCGGRCANTGRKQVKQRACANESSSTF